MNILHTVESYDPSNHGMQQVVKQLSERLVKLGHEVTIATSFHPERINTVINGVKIQHFNIKGKSVGGYTAEQSEIDRYTDYVINSSYDIITNFAAQQWATDLLLPVLKQIKAVKVFVPTGFSGLFDNKFVGYFEKMRTWIKDYDMNVFLSNDYRDINFARATGIDKIIIIPNGAAEDEFDSNVAINIRNKYHITNNHFLIIHVGSHTGLKGHREAIRIFKNANIKNATFMLIGNSVEPTLSAKRLLIFLIKFVGSCFLGSSNRNIFPECGLICKIEEMMFRLSRKIFDRNKNILVVSLTREETIAAYRTADLFLFPSNIECSPLVLFECMASCTPFLSTDVGNAKEIISWSKSGIILPTYKLKSGCVKANIEGSKYLLEKIIQDKPLREEMANNGFVAWKKRFTWEGIAKEYESLYYSLLTERRK